MEFLKPLTRVQDARRSLTNLFRADIKDVNFYDAKLGTTLGDHFHKTTSEYFFIVKGTCIVHSEGSSRVATKGEIFLVKPLERHSIECITDVKFLTFLTEPYDHNNPDIHK